jgi:hypothetical protein
MPRIVTRPHRLAAIPLVRYTFLVRGGDFARARNLRRRRLEDGGRSARRRHREQRIRLFCAVAHALSLRA